MIKPIPGVRDVICDSWLQFSDYCLNKLPQTHSHWVFRGQRCADLCLTSTFERSNNSGRHQVKSWKYEAAILREFTRRAHHYVTDLPPANDILEWFALMRHYGAPCRLVDFSYSFYVAAYYAFKNAVPTQGPVAVWAINTDRLQKHFESQLSKKAQKKRRGDFRFKNPRDFRRHFLSRNKPKAFVATVNPFRLNQRLTSQQGLFLCPGNINLSFMDNLLSPSINEDNSGVLRIVVHSDAKKDALENLHKMNVTLATLFPDLGGFAESLSDWFHLDFKLIKKDLIAAIEGKFPGKSKRGGR